MKHLATIIFVILVLAILAAYLVTYQVRETESALITTFGKPKEEVSEPGLHIKWPIPIQRVYKFDSRMRVFEAELGETTTKGAVPIIVKTYLVWNIAEPLQFFNAVGTIREAEDQLLNQLKDVQNKVIGRHNFSEFVNSDPAQIRFRDIEQEMQNELAPQVRRLYGIEVRQLGIKQLQVSEEVSKDVFERMRAERNRKTEATIAQGKAQATKIRTDADSKKTELLAAAEARAKAIRGQGDAEAAKYYKMLEADPELAMFLRDIEALKRILEKRSTVVLSGDSEPFRLLKNMPDLTAPKPPVAGPQAATDSTSSTQ
jgi:membrane protease subunit HflC